MPESIPCPRCGEYTLVRSRSRNTAERLFKRILPARTYRCRECRWRGWLSNRRLRHRKPLARELLFYLIVILISLIAALILKNTF